MRHPKVWYTSDLHIGHRLVSGLRKFVTVEEAEVEEWRNAKGELVLWNETKPATLVADPAAHDAAVAANWDRVVGEDDTVFVLGDISINGGQYALDWIAERPGVKHLISGNHDPVHPGIFRTRAAKNMLHWLHYFETIQPYYTKKLDGRYVQLSHFPYAEWGDGPGRPGSRYDQYRLPDVGAPLLHGHTHGTEVAHGHSYHVGLDAHSLELVPQDTILEWLATLPQPEAAPAQTLRA